MIKDVKIFENDPNLIPEVIGFAPKGEMEDCPICHDRHESAMFGGVRYIGCPEVPQNLMVPFNKRDSDGKLEFAMTPKRSEPSIGFAEKPASNSYDVVDGIVVHAVAHDVDCAQFDVPDVQDCPDFKLPASFTFNPDDLEEQLEIREQEWLHYRKCRRCNPKTVRKSKIAELEHAVIETAVTWLTHDVDDELRAAVESLLKAREK